MTAAPTSGDSAAASRDAPRLERGTIVRGVVIAALLVVALVRAARSRRRRLDHDRSRASRSTRSSALGFGILYGRVGMISLGQVALLTIGCWIGDAPRLRDRRCRSRCCCSSPAAITCAIGMLVGLPALRLSGLYLALITLMFAGATTVVLVGDRLPERRRRLHGPVGDRRR